MASQEFYAANAFHHSETPKTLAERVSSAVDDVILLSRAEGNSCQFSCTVDSDIVDQVIEQLQTKYFSFKSRSVRKFTGESTTIVQFSNIGRSGWGGTSGSHY